MVRIGRVQRIEADQIVLANGSVPTDPNRIYVDCSSSAAERRPIIPIFCGNVITPEFFRAFQPTFSAAFIAHVKASYSDEGDDSAAKNLLCTVAPLADKPVHWLHVMAINMANQSRWSKDKALGQWILQSRLDGFSAIARSVKPDETAELALLERFGKNAALAGTKLPQLLAESALKMGLEVSFVVNRL